MVHSSYPIISRMIVWVVLPALLILLMVYRQLLQSLPQLDGVLRVDGMDSQVRVIRDERAVPHIFATTDHDAFFAIGYLHAQDRLWQMEYQRRIGQGRLSEIFGPATLPTDKLMRTLGIYRAAQTAVDSLDKVALHSLMAYVDGVNAWIQEGNTLPLEYHILGFEPEPWRPEDSLLQPKLMAYSLDSGYTQELAFEVLVNTLGLSKAADLMPNYSPQDYSSQADLPMTGLLDVVIEDGLLTQGEYIQNQLHLGIEGLGSNAWVVSGRFTNSGKPLLANDPHLVPDIPSDWYIAEIRGERLHVSGATYPGFPLVILGHNESITWGATALAADVQDLYVIRTNPFNENQYEIDNKWEEMAMDDEWINVKPEFPSFLRDPIPPLRLKVRRTRHGPLISDVIGRAAAPLALRWTALDESDKTYQSFLGINYAKDWAAFKLALDDHLAPSLNFLYADIEGNIGYTAAGKIPIRQLGDGRLPAPGWQSGYEWESYIPRELLPQSINPELGYIVNANNKIHDSDYPYLISNSWEPPYRADRISEVIQTYIESGSKLDVQAMFELQGDYKSLQAENLLKFIGRLEPKTPQQSRAINQLKQWDGVISEDSVAAAIYQSWFRHFNRLILNDELRGDIGRPERLDVLEFYTAELNPVLIERVVSRSQGDGEYNWCDQVETTQHETCDSMALTALDIAIDELIGLTGSEKKWGDIHKTYYQHRGLTSVQLLDYFLNRSVGSGGDSYTVNVGGWRYSEDDGYRQFISPGYRQVIDLSDWNRSVYINSPGQSGNVFSPHYDDNILAHQKMEFFPMSFGIQQGLGDDSILLLEPIQESAAEREEIK